MSDPAISGGAEPADGGLVDFVARVVGEGPLRVEETLGAGFVRLRVSEAERRQAKHDIRWVEDAAIELLRNSRDAGARRIFFATAREGDRRTLLVVDDGAGIPETMWDRVFEARVTSKLDTMSMDRWGVHGRGMALFSIRQNALEARVCASFPGGGCSLSVAFDCPSLPERADQSTWPRVGKGEDGRPAAVRGPHNIVRTAVEFALESRGAVDVYLGTPAEILAALVEVGCAHLAALPASSEDGAPADLPIWLWPACAVDARGLAEAAGRIGIDVSERTCYRILNGEFAPAETLVERVLPGGGGAPAAPVDLLRDRRGLKVAPSDLADFTQALRSAFGILGERYYLGLRGEPQVRIARDSVVVTFDIEKEM